MWTDQLKSKAAEVSAETGNVGGGLWGWWPQQHRLHKGTLSALCGVHSIGTFDSS